MDIVCIANCLTKQIGIPQVNWINYNVCDLTTLEESTVH